MSTPRPGYHAHPSPSPSLHRLLPLANIQFLFLVGLKKYLLGFLLSFPLASPLRVGQPRPPPRHAPPHPASPLKPIFLPRARMGSTPADFPSLTLSQIGLSCNTGPRFGNTGTRFGTLEQVHFMTFFSIHSFIHFLLVMITMLGLTHGQLIKK